MNQLFPSAQSGLFGRRQRLERGARVPLTVLTGFLGSPEGAGTALVVNEFGAAGIDDALLRSSADETALIGNGCLCCVTRSDLQITLRRLVADRARGAIPDFRRIVIETSGLADPGPILQTFATDKALGEEFHVEAVVTVADAATGPDTLGWSAEARKQAILADTLVVTKGDIAGEPNVAALTTKLRALNPRAAIVTAVSGALDPHYLIAAPATERSGFIAETAHSDGIASFTLTADKPVAWPAFARTMETLTALRGPDLLRVKGFVDVEGCAGPVLVQFVQHLAHPPVELERWPDDARGTRVVFITRHISEKQVRDLFAAVSALAK
jgi:G3E family GTPase